MMTMAVMMMMPSCCVKADRSFPVDGEGRGGPHSEAVSHKTGPAGSSEDRHRPKLNFTLQIGAALVQVEQSEGAPHRS